MKRASMILVLVFPLAITLACQAPILTAGRSTMLPGPGGAATSIVQGASEEPAVAGEPTQPPVAGQEPSYRVAAFYYPWYGSIDSDGRWIHWDQAGHTPPEDIGSDYYPWLGAYSSNDPSIVAQHFSWLRKAGVGVIVSSWWGRGSREDQAVPTLLDVAVDYDIKVAFHIEPYEGRTADRLVQDVEYLYAEYGDHPAFFRTTEVSRWSTDAKSKGLFYLWSSGYPNSASERVEPSYWQNALDSIHGLPDGGIVLADETLPEWVDGGHFDGLYDYAVLDINREAGYSWARGLPSQSWYVPGVNPGFSAQRIGYDPALNTPRQDGDTYQDRWQAALDADVEPAIITITTFNEWHEGTQIEPAAAGITDGHGNRYKDYGELAPEGYLSLTRQWVDRFFEKTWPEGERLRLRLATTSDWTELRLVSGATWHQPDTLSVSLGASEAGMRDGRLALIQPIAQAEAGQAAELVVDLLFSRWEPGGEVVFEINRGDLGSTEVELFRYEDQNPIPVEAFEWAGITGDGRNAFSYQVQVAELFGEVP